MSANFFEIMFLILGTLETAFSQHWAPMTHKLPDKKKILTTSKKAKKWRNNGKPLQLIIQVDLSCSSRALSTNSKNENRHEIIYLQKHNPFHSDG